ncbi:hypothetical protein [Streptomyces sp. NPDC057702]|uniref:hypothetical protein n=1 Tax=unclassified Streptomyces TaxID=2593676 RepID=UPI0036B706AF
MRRLTEQHTAPHAPPAPRPSSPEPGDECPPPAAWEDVGPADEREHEGAWGSPRLAVGAVLALGSVGAVLVCADLASPVRAPFTLFFLVVAPASAIGAALRGVDPLSRPVLAVAGAVVLDLVVAQVMLALRLWSARGGVLVVGLLSLLLVLVTLARRLRRRTAAGNGARRARGRGVGRTVGPRAGGLVRTARRTGGVRQPDAPVLGRWLAHGRRELGNRVRGGRR